MPITFECACGKALRVPDQYLGKRIKCPGCGETQTVSPGDAPAPKKQSAAASGMIRFSCECGKQMQTKSEHAGSIVDCPSCGAEVEVPGSGKRQRNEALTADRPSGRGDRGGRDDDDDLDDYRPKRKKKGRRGKKGGNVWLWVGIAAGVLILLGGGFAAWWIWGGGGSEDDLALIPADAQMFVTIRASEVWNNQLVQDNLVNLLPPDAKQEQTKFESATGITPAGIERVTIVYKSLELEQFWVIFKTKEDFDFEKIKQYAKEQPGGGDLTEETYKGQSFFVASDSDKSAMLKVSDNVLVIGNGSSGIKACIDQMKDPVTSGPLEGAIERANGTDHFFAAGTIPSQLTNQLAGGGGAPGINLSFLKNLSRLEGSINLSSNIDLQIRGNVGDESSAGQAKDALNGFKFLGGTLIGAQEGLPQASKKQIVDMINAIQVTSEGSEVVLKTSLDPNTLKQLAGGLIGGGLPGGGGFPGGNPGGFPGGNPGGLGGIQGAADRAKRSNNLKQMALAMHSYHDDKNRGALPQPAITDQSGKPLLSWRVEILPYIEQENLYNQIRKNEPWDSAHNRQFWNQMPKVFESPGLPTPAGQTRYMVFSGPKTPFERGKKLPIFRINDGTSNTIMIIEAGQFTNWMQPRDISFRESPSGLRPIQIGRTASLGPILTAFCDGSVVQINPNCDPKDFQAAVTANGGETYDRSKLER